MSFRILIVDDHDMVRKALRMVVETHAGWQVCAEAQDGRTAVRAAAELHPDVVILDLVMPEMNGLQAAHEILAAKPRTPIILHTAHASSVLAAQAEKSGIRFVVSKGSIQQLVSAIEAALCEKLLEKPVCHPSPKKDVAET